MVKTRRPGSRHSALRSYRRRVTKRLNAVALVLLLCRGRVGCKYASGRKRSFCRKGLETPDAAAALTAGVTNAAAAAAQNATAAAIVVVEMA